MTQRCNTAARRASLPRPSATKNELAKIFCLTTATMGCNLRAPFSSASDSMDCAVMHEQHTDAVWLKFRPSWAYIDGIREFCGFFCNTALSDRRFTERVQLIAQELLENAVKYSDHASTSSVVIEMLIERSKQDFMIAVSNAGTLEMVDALRKEIATIASMEPQEAYSYAMRRVARSGTSTNRLGFARLRCDGQVEISATMTEDGRIRVEARGTI